jgi:hypothetical protein
MLLWSKAVSLLDGLWGVCKTAVLPASAKQCLQDDGAGHQKHQTDAA